MDMFQVAHKNVWQAQDHYKKYADAHWRLITFNKGDYVFLRVPEKFQTLKIGPTPKLLPQFYGLIKIIKKVGHIAYKICHQYWFSPPKSIS